MAPTNTENVEESSQAEGTSPGTPTRRAAGEGNVDSPAGEHVEPSRRFAKEADLRGHVDPTQTDDEDGSSAPQGSGEGDPTPDPAASQSGTQDPGSGDDGSTPTYETSDVPENADDVVVWISGGTDDDDSRARAAVAMEVEYAREKGVRTTVSDRASTYLNDSPES